jgi:hypothetical protein
MPLERGSSQAVISRNISELTHHGSRKRPHDQIVAIALHQADKSRKHLAGGGLGTSAPFYEREEARNLERDSYHPGGLFASDVAGRTDRLPHSVAADSFVMPADVVSGLGQGNTLAGAKIMDGILHSGPYGTSLPRPGRLASGGNAPPGISKVMVAGGEYSIPPDKLTEIGRRLRAAGKSKARTDLAAGHEWARGFVDRVRKQSKQFLAKAPKPKK